MFATREATRRFERSAALGLAYEAKVGQRILQDAVNDSVRVIRDLIECGVDVDYAEFIKGLLDALNNADAALLKTMDEVPGFHAEPIDLKEVRELIERVRK